MLYMKTRALFLDRDGVINVDRGYVYRIEDFEFCEGIFEFCNFFQEKGFLIFMVTNQSGIARGYYTEEDFRVVSAFVLAMFSEKKIKISKIYHCPHLKDCNCRKPKPGMLLKAKSEFDIDMQNSFFVGDNLSDMEAGLNAGVGNLVLIGSSPEKVQDFRSFSDLKEALSFFKQEGKI